MDQKKLSFIPQLDSFRFIAVCLVIISHWLPGNIINRIIPNGFIGVTFFFVLSGYLISTNLLYAKESIDAGYLTRGRAFKVFYIRRTIRIFPLYYFVVISVYLLNKNIYDGHIIWYLTYLPNFLVFKEQHWMGMLSHLWSLGAEEQFYLVWPFLIFFIREKYLKFLFPGIVLASVLCKFCFFIYIPENTCTSALTISCLDAFGVGASLALLTLKEKQNDFIFSNKNFWLYFIAMVITSAIVFINGIIFLLGFCISIVSALIIIKATKGFKGLGGKILDHPILLYLGKISYGIYIYHFFIPWLIRCIRGQEITYPTVIPVFPMNWLHNPFLLMGIEFLVLIIIASLSWFLIEKPILKFKKYFV